jgi:hypothetical protein
LKGLELAELKGGNAAAGGGKGGATAAGAMQRRARATELRWRGEPAGGPGRWRRRGAAAARAQVAGVGGAAVAVGRLRRLQ